MRIKRYLGLCGLFSVMMTAGCMTRYATNGEHLYLGSTNGPKLVVPSSLSAESVSHFYDLPPSSPNAGVDITP
jgi:uncharacterized lipoprotein